MNGGGQGMVDCNQLLSFKEKPLHPELIRVNNLIGFCKYQSAHISKWVCEHGCSYGEKVESKEDIIEEESPKPKKKADGLFGYIKKWEDVP
jgi:hypothetical protein